MTSTAVDTWLAFMDNGDQQLLHDMLADDAVFYSPAVFTPQTGKATCARYLRAAERMFAGSDFRYVNQWFDDESAVLEFVVALDGVHIEGIDMLTWNSGNKITSVKVMVRPLRGLQSLISRMGELLKQPAT